MKIKIDLPKINECNGCPCLMIIPSAQKNNVLNLKHTWCVLGYKTAQKIMSWKGLARPRRCLKENGK